jgi:hypothetical protein
LAAEGKAEELELQLRTRARKSLYYFTKVVLGYDRLVDHLHLPLCDHIQDFKTRRKRGYLLPRGHFKSTIVSKSYPLWRLCGGGLEDEEWDLFQQFLKGEQLLREPIDPRNLRILTIGESDTVAQKNLRDIKHNLRENQLLQWLFPWIIPKDIGRTKWTEEEILLPRSKSFDESTLSYVGVGKRYTGFHFDIIIYDDVIGFEAAMSEAEMQRAKDYVDYAPGLLNEQATGEELFAGTRWKHGTADVYGYYMEKNPEFKWFIRAAVENGKPIFPERFPMEELARIRNREHDYKFNCNYMNDPTPPEGGDFQQSWIKTFKVGPDSRTLIPNDGTPPTNLSKLVRMSFYDPAGGGKTGNCEQAVGGAGMDFSRRIFVFEAWGKNCTAGEAVEQWLQLNDKFLFWSNFFEDVGVQRSIKDIILLRNLEAECPACSLLTLVPPKKVKHRHLFVDGVNPRGGSTSKLSKEERMRFYAQEAFRTGKVYIREDLFELIRQITGFPHSDRFDRFETVCYLINLLRPPMSEEEETEEREQQELHQIKLAEPRVYSERSYGGYV